MTNLLFKLVSFYCKLREKCSGRPFDFGDKSHLRKNK